VERRKGGETGVKAVQCVQGEEMWKQMDQGAFSKSLLEAAMEKLPAHAKGDYREPTAKTQDAGVFLIEYRDGLKAAVAMPHGWAHGGGGGAFPSASPLKGAARPRGRPFYPQHPPPFAPSAYLLKAIAAPTQTSHAAYPVERMLLTTGVLDAVMTSKGEKHRR